jgi:hypothetical protein
MALPLPLEPSAKCPSRASDDTLYSRAFPEPGFVRYSDDISTFTSSHPVVTYFSLCAEGLPRQIDARLTPWKKIAYEA